jgi:L-aspartate oxidase
MRFPTVHASCAAAGIDPARDLIPVAPAVHYHMGGVATDATGRTSLDGLWAAGEVASTGVHGANRLASNSLLEAVVYAARVAEDISGLLPRASPPPARWSADPTPRSADPMRGSDRTGEYDLRRLMAEHVGVIRNRDGLRRALATLVRIGRDAATRPLRDMATAALIITAAAWRRTESRGGHYRSDFPGPDAAQARRTFLTLGDARAIAEHALHRAAEPAI